MSSSRKLCVFCDSPATTKDHVPPKCIFPGDRRKNLKTVPACHACNSATKKDDEYFRIVVATAANDSDSAGAILRNKILPGAQVRPGLLKQVIGTIEPIDIHSDRGIYMGQKPAFTYDASRVHPIVEKIVKGLFYIHNAQPLRTPYRVDDFRLQPDLPDEAIAAVSSLPLHSVEALVFEYRFYWDQSNVNYSYWFLMFYRSVLFFSRTVSDAEL